MGFWGRQLSLFSSLRQSTDSGRLREKSPPAPVSPSQVSPRPPVKRKRRDKVATLNNEFHALMWEIAQSVEEFSNFDFRRLKVSVGTSRSKGKYGVWAYVTPLRYIGGALYRKGRRYGVAGRYTYEMKSEELDAENSPLYMITVMVPRFFNLSFKERLETLVHEMYHIHPTFRGDLRRFPKPHIHHGPTPKAFNLQVEEYAKEALSRDPSLRDHPLLRASAEGFTHLKKRRFASPTLKFEPSRLGIFSWILVAGLGLASMLWTPISSARSQLGAPQSSSREVAPLPRSGSRNKRIKEKAMRIDPQAHYISNLKFFDANQNNNRNPRYVVSPKQKLKLRSAPSQWSTPMHEVSPGEKFLAYTVDKSGKWVLLRSRVKQGWYPKEKIQIVGKLVSPTGGGSWDGKPGSRSGSHLSSNIIKDGDRVYVPSKADWNSSDISQLDAQTDKVVVTNGGSFYEAPDPLATKFGLLESGDKLKVLKRDRTGEWAYVRLELTKEEGWFPSEWMKVVEGTKVRSAGLGRFVLDVDGNWGTTGRNYGYGVGGLYGLRSSSTLFARRFEVGAFFQQSTGETLTLEGSSQTFTLSSSYSLMGFLLRYVAFSGGGILGGALEAAGTFQQTQADLSGLSDAVIGESGIQKAVASRFGLMIGVRGMVSLSRSIQLNTLLRANFAESSNTYWGGAGLSFRF